MLSLQMICVKSSQVIRDITANTCPFNQELIVPRIVAVVLPTIKQACGEQYPLFLVHRQ